MKKIIASLTALSSVFCSAEAVAQNQPLACQSDASAGLAWEKGRWVVSSFLTQKFILVKTSDVLTRESVAKAFNNVPTNVIQCKKSYKERVMCSDDYGDFLFFDPTTLKGGISLLYGAVQSDSDTSKDTVSVTAFSCTPF